jgi:hypothetical protein
MKEEITVIIKNHDIISIRLPPADFNIRRMRKSSAPEKNPFIEKCRPGR